MNNKLIFRICIPAIIVLLIIIAILIPVLIRQYSYHKYGYTVKNNKIVYDDYSLTFSCLHGAVKITGIENIEGNTANVTIPESIDVDGSTLTVTTIGDYAFYECTALTKITFGEELESIGEHAFSGCPASRSFQWYFY